MKCAAREPDCLATRVRGSGREQHLAEAAVLVVVSVPVVRGGSAPGRGRCGGRRRRRGRVTRFEPGEVLELAIVQEDPPAVTALLDMHPAAVVSLHHSTTFRTLHAGDVTGFAGFMQRRQSVPLTTGPAQGAGVSVRRRQVSTSAVSRSSSGRPDATAKAAAWTTTARAGRSSAGQMSPSDGMAGPPDAR